LRRPRGSLRAGGERHPDLVVQAASVPPQGAGVLGRPDAASQALSTCLRPAGHFGQTGQILQIGLVADCRAAAAPQSERSRA